LDGWNGKVSSLRTLQPLSVAFLVSLLVELLLAYAKEMY
jgi:hypothetical protein